MNCFTSFYSVKCAKIKFLVSLKKISCFIELDRVKFYWIVFGHSNNVSSEKTRVLASQMTEI